MLYIYIIVGRGVRGVCSEVLSESHERVKKVEATPYSGWLMAL